MFNNLNIKYHIDDYILNLIDEIEVKLDLIDIKGDSKKKLIKQKTRARSIYSSLAIEDNQLSFDSVSKIIDNKLVLGLKKDVQEVKNANQVYEHINDYNYKCENDLIKAHSIFMLYLDDDNGNYRNHGEGVKKGNKIIYKAPDSIIVPDLMNSLFKYINDSNNIHPFVLASIFHYYFVYIHPFTDGNGRLARFWFNLILYSYNNRFIYLPIEEEIFINKNKYYDVINECHNNSNVNVFIRFMLEMINETLNKLLTIDIKITKTEKMF